MNKYVTFPGLQPVYLGDIDFLQESVRSAFLMLLRGLTGQENPRCIIAEATPEKDGVICFDGEILPLKYYTGSDTMEERLCYKIVVAYSGSRTFKDGEVKNCYETRHVEVFSGSFSSPDRMSEFPLIQKLMIRSVRIQQQQSWVSMEGNQVSLKTYDSHVGNLYTLLGEFSIKEDCTVSSLTEKEIEVNLSTGEYYFPVSVTNGSVLKTLGAKMTVRLDSDTNRRMASININRTSFTEGDAGSFTFNTVK